MQAIKSLQAIYLQKPTCTIGSKIRSAHGISGKFINELINLKILIISDLHGNKEALEAINEDYDYIFCLGDLVDYGPDSEFTIDYAKSNVNYIVKGNHDNAVGFNANCRCHPSFKKISIATRNILLKKLPEKKIEYLRFLPVTEKINLPSQQLFLVHAMPSNPLYKNIDENDYNSLKEEIDYINLDYLFVGHNHKQWSRKIGHTTIVSPGSVGMSKDFPGYSTYAIWEDGNIILKKVKYDLEKTLSKIDKMPLTGDLKDQIKKVFTFGEIK